MRAGVNCYRSVRLKAPISLQIDPKTAPWRQEWIKSLFLTAVLALMLILLAIAIYLTLDGGRKPEEPGTRRFGDDSRAYVHVAGGPTEGVRFQEDLDYI